MHWESSTEKKFKTQLLLVLLIVGVLVVTGSLFYIDYQKKLTTKRSQQTISAIASLKVDQLVQWNKERLSEVSFFSTSQSVLRYALPVIAGDKSSEPQLIKTLEHMLSDNRYDDIALINSTGEVLFSVASRMHSIDSTNNVLLDSVFRTRSIVFRDFYTCIYENMVRAYYLAPIVDNQSRVVAGLFFMIDPFDFFYPSIESWPVPSSTAQTYLVKKVQDAINYLSPMAGVDKAGTLRHIKRDSLDDIGLAVLSTKEGFIEGKDHHGERIMAYAQPVPGTDWLLISTVSKNELFADYKRIAGLALLFSITLLLFLWGGIVWAYKRRQRRMFDELYKKSRDLHRSQEEFGATLYSIGEGVIATDDKGFVTRMNTAAESLTGWTEADAKGKPIEEIFLTVDVDTLSPGAHCVRLALQQGKECLQNHHGKTILVAKDGSQAYVSASVAPIKGLEGKLYGAVLVFRDQSEEQARKHMTEARLNLFEYATSHNLKETLEHTMQISSDLFKSPICLFLTVESGLEGLTVKSFGLPENADFRSHAVWSTSLETLQPALYDYKQDSEEANRKPLIEKALVVPVVRENKPVAFFGLANRAEGFSPTTVEHVSYLADVIWVITNEKQKESSLLESEDKYRNLVNQMQVGLALHEMILENGVPVNYRFLEVNPSYERLTGLTREQLIGNTLLEVLPESEPYWIDNFGRVVLNKEPIVIEEFSGALNKFYSVTAYPVGDMKFAAIVEDVTERRQMIDALLSNEQSYRDLIDNIKDTVWIVDENGKLFDVNNQVTKQLGYSKEEILQLGVKGIDATLSEKEILHINDLILSGESQMFEAVHRAKNGKLIPVEVNTGRVNYMGKQVAVCLARDISQRKRAEGFQHLLYEIASFSSGSGSFEDLLAVVRNELGKVMDATNFYVALYNPSTENLDELIFINEKYSIHSWPVEGTLSGHVLKTGKSLLLCGDDRQDFLKLHHINEVKNPSLCWMGVPMSDDNASIGVLVLQHYTDPNAYDTSNLQILETVAHELSVVIQSQRMINDLIHAKEKAEESDRLKTAFLANVSHEVRTPMNGILGFIEMLEDPETEPEQRADYVDIVMKSGQRLLTTIEDIIEISRIEAGLIELHEVITDLTEIMSDQFSLNKALAEEKGIEFELKEHLTEQDAIVEIDRLKLNAILSNLLNNAFKFTRSGSIVFGNSIQDNELLFYVKDTGLGIPKDRQEAIFQRFVQADLNTTRPHEGSGLGLSIVKAYLEKMGGRIWVESEPNKGSTFYFALPHKPMALPIIEIKETTQANVNGTSVSVLVAEDDPIGFMYIEALLSKESVVVYHASNGKEAVELYKQYPEVDAILMDIKMPVMNGLDATREIRQLNKQVPIIAQTAYAFVEDKEKAMDAGCTDFLTKPTTREQLLFSLKAHIPRLKKVD